MKTKSLSTQAISKLNLSPALILNVISAGFALLLGSTQILGSPSPFAVAFVASLPTRLTATSFLLASFGYTLSFGFEGALAYIFSMVLIIVNKNIFTASKKLASNRKYLCLLSGGSYLVMNTLIAIAFSKPATDYFMIVLDSVICAGVTLCFTQATTLFSQRDNKTALSLSQRTCLAVLSMVVLLCLAQIEFAVFNLGAIVALFVVAVTTYCIGSVAGVMTCVLAGGALTLHDRSMLTFFAVLTFCSLISGVFRFWGKIGQVAVLIFTSLVSMLVVGVSVTSLEVMLNLLVALTVLLIVPQTVLEKITLKAEFYLAMRTDITHKEYPKMKFASNTLVNLKSTFEQAYSKLRRKKLNDIDSIISACSSKVCKKCPKSTYCWIDEYNTTMDHFNKMAGVAVASGKIEVADMPSYMHKNCIRTMAVANFITSQCDVKPPHTSEIDQFQSCVDMLCDITHSPSQMRVRDEITARIVEDTFVQLGLTPSDVVALVDSSGKASIDVFFAGKVVCDTDEISQALSSALGKSIQSGEIAVIGSQSKLSFFDKPDYAFRSFVIQKPAKVGDKCGDSICAFTDSKAVRHIVLSDGMGTGGEAALDSAITVDFIKSLIISGFDYKSALQFINSSLQLRTEESLATVDALTVDLYSGTIGFKKAGSASSFIKTSQECIKVNTQSLPIGIIKDVELDEQDMKLSSGDIVVMVSDGVIENSSEWLVSYLKESTSADIEKICKEIYRQALENSEKGHSDDMTVMVGMLVKN